MPASLDSFIGIVIGAILQYIITRHLSITKHHRDPRTKAYIDYLKAVCEQSNVDIQNRDSLKSDLRIKVADAKCRICLYGSRAAIQSFAEFEKAGANITRNPAKITEMVVIMRNDSKREKAASKDIESMLIGKLNA
ncbi:hypothetical protein [Synechococcus sp. BMK-MC-1]|uniref:hypothetical protein n=1 Tax=Synechococcus sp. BMK-MC-1 TaxID=1442551 RepID=UPI0016457191|nr:hypothetical protein [Synechococcus sp. BMK-MC-1]